MVLGGQDPPEGRAHTGGRVCRTVRSPVSASPGRGEDQARRSPGWGTCPCWVSPAVGVPGLGETASRTEGRNLRGDLRDLQEVTGDDPGAAGFKTKPPGPSPELGSPLGPCHLPLGQAGHGRPSHSRTQDLGYHMPLDRGAAPPQSTSQAPAMPRLLMGTLRPRTSPSAGRISVQRPATRSPLRPCWPLAPRPSSR